MTTSGGPAANRLSQWCLGTARSRTPPLRHSGSGENPARAASRLPSMGVNGARAGLRRASEADRRRIAQGERPLQRVSWAVGPDPVDVPILEWPIGHLFVP